MVHIVMGENSVPIGSKEIHLGKQINNFNSSHILFVGPIHTGEFAEVTKSKKAEKQWSRLCPS